MGLQPAGPASGAPSGLQPGGSVQSFTCFHLLGAKVSAAGMTGTSTVLLTVCLCTISISFCSWRSIFLRWRRDGCLLGGVEAGSEVFWITSRVSAPWASVSTCCWPGRFLPASQIVFLSASCLSASSSLSSTLPVHSEPPMSLSRLSQKLEIRTQESLRLCRTFPVSRRPGIGGG